MLPKPVLVQATNDSNQTRTIQRHLCREIDQESQVSSVVGSDPPREPHRKERSSRLILLRLASCCLKAWSSFCSWSQESASLLKNYIFPSSTLTNLCKHQNIVGDWDRPEGEWDGSYPAHLLRKFLRLWLLFSSHYHPQLFNFHRHCLLSRMQETGAFPSLTA